jgi:hypothetical protein
MLLASILSLAGLSVEWHDPTEKRWKYAEANDL